jgi:hypothetical protein
VASENDPIDEDEEDAPYTETEPTCSEQMWRELDMYIDQDLLDVSNVAGPQIGAQGASRTLYYR